MVEVVAETVVSRMLAAADRHRTDDCVMSMKMCRTMGRVSSLYVVIIVFGRAPTFLSKNYAFHVRKTLLTCSLNFEFNAFSQTKPKASVLIEILLWFFLTVRWLAGVDNAEEFKKNLILRFFQPNKHIFYFNFQLIFKLEGGLFCLN